MKKNMLVLSVIAVSVLVSAFAMKRSDRPSKFANFYWYPVKHDGNIDHLHPINGGAMMSRTYLLSNPGLIPCPTVPGPDCIRAFTTIQVYDGHIGNVDAFEKQYPQ